MLLGNKIDPGNNASRVAKLGNVGETCTRYGFFLETCFLVLPGLKVSRYEDAFAKSPPAKRDRRL